MAGVIKTLQQSDGVAVAASTAFNGIVVVTSADITITDTDGYSQIDVSTGAANRTVTFPAPSAANAGRVWYITKTDSGTGGVILAGTISGYASNNTIKAQYGTAVVRSNGTALFYVRDIAEDGSWTPATNFTGVQSGGADSGASGQYVRNGRTVSYSGYVGLTDTGGAATGSFRISGLPFTSGSDSNGYAASASRIEDRVTTPAQVYDQYSYVAPSSALIQFFFLLGNAGLATAVTAADINNSLADITIGGNYHID